MDQQFSLSWNNFHGNLTRGFTGLLGKGEFVDVTIAVEGHLLQAHKVILSICSPYFKKMFQLNPCHHPIVVLRDVSHKAMKDLLQFMYHGEVSVKREDLTSFIGTAEVLQIKGLTNKETEDGEVDSEQDLPKHSNRSHINTGNSELCRTEQVETSLSEDQPQKNENGLLKQKEFLERLHRLSNLKRKSDEFIHNNFFNSNITSMEKRQKFKENNSLGSQCVNHTLDSNTYDHNTQNVFEDRATVNNDSYCNHITSLLQRNNSTNEGYDDKNETEQTLTNDNELELKTECEDTDNLNISDSALCTTPKSYESSKEEQTAPVDYQMVQDNCSGLGSLFMDLKNFVNGKGSKVSHVNNQEDFARDMMSHRLVTIPQKEDGKKKYPQRSCRLCWKLGKRRDTRFMCSACELPFCKSPCFEVHFNHVIKASQMHTDYFAN